MSPVDRRRYAHDEQVVVHRIDGIPGPYWFFFYSFDCNEPMHVHVRRDRQQAKFWLEPVALAWNHGFSPRELNEIRRLVVAHKAEVIEAWHDTVVSVENRIERVEVSDPTITAYLVDGRVISVPLAWSWRLSDATPKQRANWELIGDGRGVHWPDIDEDISAEGMLNGIPARRPRRNAAALRSAHKALQPTSRAQKKGTSKRRARAARD